MMVRLGKYFTQENKMFKHNMLNFKAVSSHTNLFVINIEALTSEGLIRNRTTYKAERDIQKYLPILKLIEDEDVTTSGVYADRSIVISKDASKLLLDIAPRDTRGLTDIFLNSIDYYDENGSLYSVDFK